ncbi:MAG: DegT/DnrJ/EryC1/StrS family aminotransferase [Actinomycetia bacterium]|nr:DegT/DnrJ/EryC1/StrS family aminotransferase [Actinomycetes bacterium]
MSETVPAGDLEPVPFYQLRNVHADLRDAFVASLDEVLEGDAFIGGPWVEAFEASWADYCGVAHSVGVANGTDAIELVLRALGLGAGDEVIVPTNTFVATAEAVVAVGATPRFVDVDPGTLLLDADTVRAAIGPRTAAVMAVHLYGQPVDVAKIRKVTDPRGIPVVEDAAQAHGASHSGVRAGGLGVAGCFSFYPGKNLGALGDGGAVTTSDRALADNVRILANHGRGAGHHDHVTVGRNSRLDGLQAAFLSQKLPLLDGWNQARTEVFERYRCRLADRPVDVIPQDRAARSVHHVMVVRVPEREEFRRLLSMHGVATSVHYPIACHRQPAFQEHDPGYLPFAERAASRVVSLPMFPDLTERQVDQVCEVVDASLTLLGVGS